MPPLSASILGGDEEREEARCSCLASPRRQGENVLEFPDNESRAKDRDLLLLFPPFLPGKEDLMGRSGQRWIQASSPHPYLAYRRLSELNRNEDKA